MRYWPSALFQRRTIGASRSCSVTSAACKSIAQAFDLCAGRSRQQALAQASQQLFVGGAVALLPGAVQLLQRIAQFLRGGGDGGLVLVLLSM